MLTFSREIEGKSPQAQRRLYTLFQREVKAGQIPALKLLTKFEIQGTKGQARQVQDFAFTDGTGEQVKQWLNEQEQPKQAKGYRVEDVQGLSDDDLGTLIQQQQQSKRKRKARAKKNTKEPSQEATKAPENAK